MPKTQYRRIAERYPTAAALTAPITEASGFASCHAFESIACAWIRYKAQSVPIAHVAKAHKFVALAGGRPFYHGARVLSVLTVALRYKLRYPLPDGSGGYTLPEHNLTTKSAADLQRRIAGVVRLVIRDL